MLLHKMTKTKSTHFQAFWEFFYLETARNMYAYRVFLNTYICTIQWTM